MASAIDRFVHRHDAVDDALDDRERRIAQLADREPVGERVRQRDGRRHILRERLGEARRAVRLHATIFTPGAFALTAVPIPAIRPPPPTGTTMASDVGRLLEDLESHGALAGDHVDVVERMDEREALARGDFTGMRARLGQVRAVQDDLGAELAAVGHLDQRRENGHHDGRGNAEELRVIGDSLRVIAGGRGDHAASSLLRRQLQQGVARAALLEAAGALQVIELAVDMRAGELRQRNRFDARRVIDATGDAVAGSLDVGERHHAKRGLEGQRNSRLRGIEHATELGFDPFQRRLVVRFEAQHDDRRRVRAARESETVRILDAQAVDANDVGGPGKLCGVAQFGHEAHDARPRRTRH
jgi:hypothetical protein